MQAKTLSLNKYSIAHTESRWVNASMQTFCIKIIDFEMHDEAVISKSKYERIFDSWLDWKRWNWTCNASCNKKIQSNFLRRECWPRSQRTVLIGNNVIRITCRLRFSLAFRHASKSIASWNSFYLVFIRIDSIHPLFDSNTKIVFTHMFFFCLLNEKKHHFQSTRVNWISN